VLTVQALFFADGGILALGCNIFNLGFFPCFIAYPFLYRPFAGSNPTPMRIAVGAVLGGIVGLQLGALAVVTETVLSNISELPLQAFLAAMLPIHLGIGRVEGLVTAAVVSFIWKARPAILRYTAESRPLGHLGLKKVLVGLGAAALITGGALSWFASSNPDGLEWSMAKASGREELETPATGIHRLLAGIQEHTSFLPDYGFKNNGTEPASAAQSQPSWPAVDKGTSPAGLVGGSLTLALAIMIGLLFRQRKQTP